MAGPWEDFQTPTAVQEESAPWNDFKESGAINPWDDYALNDFKQPKADNQFKRDELAKQTFQARLEGDQAKALSGLVGVGTEAAKAIVRAASHVDPTGFTQGLMQQYGVEPTHVIPPETFLPDIRTVSEVARKGVSGLGIDPNVILPEQYRKPAEEFVAETIASTPEMAPLLAAGTVDPRGIGRVFQAQMLQDVPQTAYAAATAPTAEERIKAGIQTGAGLAFPALIERGMRQPSVPIPDFVGRQLEMQRGALPPRGEPVAPIERVTPEQAAIAAEKMSAPFEGKLPSEPSILASEKTDVSPPVPEPAKPEVAATPSPMDTARGIIEVAKDDRSHGDEATAIAASTLEKELASKGYNFDQKLKEDEIALLESRISKQADRIREDIESGTQPPNERESNKPTGSNKQTETRVEVSQQPADRLREGVPLGEGSRLGDLRNAIESYKSSPEGSELPKVLESYSRKAPWEITQREAVDLGESVPELKKIRNRAAAKAFQDKSDPAYKKAQEDFVEARRLAVEKLGIKGQNYQQGRGLDSDQLAERLSAQQAGNYHRAQIEKAIKEGKPVPAEVLADYPDLKPTPKPAETPVEAVGNKLAELTAKVESGQKLTASEKKQYLKLRDEATKKQVEAPKPEVGMGGALAGEKNPKSQIEQLTEAAKGVAPKKLPFSERLKQDIDLEKKRTILREGATKAIFALKNTWDGIKSRWKGIENVDDLLREKGKLSAEIETRGWRVRAFESQMKKAVPSKRDQAAISKWIDAGGDPEVLKRGALETKPEFRQAYLDALNLRGDLLTTAQNARNYFEARLDEAIDAGVIKEGVEDYIHRIYESRPDVAEKVFANVQNGLLQRNPNLAKKRVFDFDFEAEKLGYKPVQSFIQRIATYESSLSKAIAAREFIKKATEMKAPDGRPVIDIKGVGIPVENAEGIREGTLIKPKFNPQLNNEPGTPNYRGDYVNKEFPSLSRWKWVSSDAGGKPIFVQGDVAIHPAFVHRINALLEPSRVRYGRYSKVTKPMLDVGSAVKQTMLDLSGFHQVQITVHGLEHKVMPWKIVKDIDFQNPNVDGLLKGGITLGGDYHGAYKEGLVGNSITRHVPWLGPVLESYHQWLFQSYIPRIKMTMALNALERNRARYGKTMTDEQIMHKTASQANSAFGELNYIMLERSKTTQDIARLILLAPDFLEARGRFAAEALTKGGESKIPGFGNEQRAALLLGALTMYVTARIANKVIDDQYHFEPENAFSIVYKGHAYSLRTVQGDILHLLEHPLQFWLNRLNPVYGRTTLEMVTGRDYFGRKRSVPEVLWDSVKNVMPISLRNSRERKLWESMMNSFGVNARRYNATDDAFKLATKWKEKNGIQERGEFIYDAEKDPLRGLKIALSQEDDAGAAKEIKKIFDSKVYDRKRLDNYFKRYASMPFTGSKANDVKFLQSLNEDEKQTVEAAKQHKRNMLKLYDQALQKYYAALQTPIK